MAPRTRTSDKKHQRLRKNEVRFPRREIPVRRSATVIRPPPNYENLILYYLTKLKRLFSAPDHPQPKTCENSADKMRREQQQQLEKKKSKSPSLEINANKYTASHTTPKPRDDKDESDNEIKEKVYNVVNAAIEYGFANNVLEKKGDCFVFKSKRNQKIANRQPTPGPSVAKRSYCAHCSCSHCKVFNSNNNREPQINNRPVITETGSNKRPDYCKRPTSGNKSNIHESKTQHPLVVPGGVKNVHGNRSSRSKSCTVHPNKKYQLRKECTCGKCRGVEQRRKLPRK